MSPIKSSQSETRQLQRLQRVIDYTHDRLRLPRVRDRLGEASFRLLGVIESMQPALSTDRDGERWLAAPDAYESTEIIPVVYMKRNEQLVHTMGLPTPTQLKNAQSVELPAHACEYRDVDAVSLVSYDSQGAVAMTCFDTLSAYDDSSERIGATYRYRPLVAVKHGMHYQSLQVLAAYIAHESAHVDHLLRHPITMESVEDDSLRTELYAYWVEHEITQEIVGARALRSASLLASIEEVRQYVNGDALDNPLAFEPSQAMKNELRFVGLDDIYR